MHILRKTLPTSLCTLATILVLCLPASAADITFYAFSDCHYGAGKPPRTNHHKVHWINDLPGTPFPDNIGGIVDKPLAVIMAGDLIDNASKNDLFPTEWANFIAEFGVNGEGVCNFPVHEGLGNHDWNANLLAHEKIKERNLQRLELGYIQNISENGYHYSWDWDGIHFINLNIFPGNVWEGEADTYNNGAHNPLFSRDFLIKDLEENVGKSGKPVIVTHHFRPIDENWWTMSAADKYHKILQDYNVILLMVGHQGGSVNNTWRGISWASSNGELQVMRITPDNTLTAIARNESAWGNTMQKKIFLSYESSGLPAVINNGDWASNVTSESATLSGKIIYEAAKDSEVTIYYGSKDGGNNPNDWEHSVNVGKQNVHEVFTTNITGLQPWTEYFYRCKVTNSKGEAWAATSIAFTSSGALPPAIKTTFVGYEQRAWGGANIKDGILTLRGSGRDIGEPNQTIDNFQYAYSNAQGNVQIQARLIGMEGNTRAAMSGIMLRENTDMGSKSVSLLYSESLGIRMFTRSETDDRTQISQSTKLDAPVNLKLVRNGNSFTGYASQDGETWTQIGEPVTVQMSQDYTSGLAVTAGNRDGSRHKEAMFENIKVNKE